MSSIQTIKIGDGGSHYVVSCETSDGVSIVRVMAVDVVNVIEDEVFFRPFKREEAATKCYLEQVVFFAHRWASMGEARGKYMW